LPAGHFPGGCDALPSLMKDEFPFCTVLPRARGVRPCPFVIINGPTHEIGAQPRQPSNGACATVTAPTATIGRAIRPCPINLLDGVARAGHPTALTPRHPGQIFLLPKPRRGGHRCCLFRAARQAQRPAFRWSRCGARLRPRAAPQERVGLPIPRKSSRRTRPRCAASASPTRIAAATTWLVIPKQTAPSTFKRRLDQTDIAQFRCRPRASKRGKKASGATLARVSVVARTRAQ